jgi:hypothetical protein
MAVAIPLAKSTDLSAMQHPLLTSVDFAPFEAEDLVPLFESDEHSGSAGESTDDGLPAEFTALLKDYNDLASAVPAAPAVVAAAAAASATKQAASPDTQSPSSSFANSPSSESDEAYGSKTSKKRNTRSATTDGSRKKAKPAYDLNEIVEHGVTLTEEFLLTCSLDIYDEIIIKLSAGRRLSAEEEATVVGQRRRVKNRESAQESRDKKKNEVKTLQTEVDGLKTTNSALATQNERLQSNVERLEKMLSLQQGILQSLFCSCRRSRPAGSHSHAVPLPSVALPLSSSKASGKPKPVPRK